MGRRARRNGRRAVLASVPAPMLLPACGQLQIDRSRDLTATPDASGADFAEVAPHECCASLAQSPEAGIMAAFPDTVRVGDAGANYTHSFPAISHRTRTRTIAVRGTRSRADMLNDIAFAPVEDAVAGAASHRGVQQDGPRILADIAPLPEPSSRTRVTGHSLGAAVLAIMMIYLIRNGSDVAHSINFGQPQFTNVAGAAQVADLTIQRVTNRQDVVPMPPPRRSARPDHGTHAHVGKRSSSCPVAAACISPGMTRSGSPSMPLGGTATSPRSGITGYGPLCRGGERKP